MTLIAMGERLVVDKDNLLLDSMSEVAIKFPTLSHPHLQKL